VQRGRLASGVRIFLGQGEDEWLIYGLIWGFWSLIFAMFFSSIDGWFMVISYWMSPF
jgi:hypothetical protein